MLSAKRILAPIFLGVFLTPLFALASDIEISPKVVDMKGRVREISHYSITLKNKQAGLLSVFVWAVDIDQAKGALANEDMSGMNANARSGSPSRWIEISRSISVLPKEEQSIPLQVQIPSDAKPGIYHVSLKFSSATTQSEAMACLQCTQEVQLNIEVTEDIREKLQLYSFASVKNIFVKPKADFNFSVENTGNRTVIPNGKIRIFDNSGKEVGLVDVNTEGKQIEPKGKDMLAASWAANGKFGKYKAMLDVSYGQRGSMQDVVYFWVVPWTRLFGFVITITAVMVIAMLFARSKAMARPQYAYNPNYEEDEEEEDVVEEAMREIVLPRRDVKMISRIPSKMNRPLRLDDSLMQNRSSMNCGLTEVNIPPRIRTVPPNSSIRLEERKRTPSEEHIVRL